MGNRLVIGMMLVSVVTGYGTAGAAESGKTGDLKPAVAGSLPAAGFADEGLAQAEAAWAKRLEITEARKAADLYQQLLAKDPANFEAAWKLARAYWWIGDHSPKAERVAVFQKGKAASENAIKLSPNAKEGHYWLGVNLGRIGEEQGVLNSLFLVDPIAKEMEATLAIDPHHGRAQHVLGVLYRKAPGWPLSRGDMKKALEFGRLAVANEPDFVITYIGLAETLMALNQKEEAKKILTTAMSLAGPTSEQPETAEDKAKAQKLLKTLQ